MIKKLRVKNYKSLRDVELELGKFNVLIGPNNSGKSNILDCFAFLYETSQKSIHEAFLPRGRYEHVVFGGQEKDIEFVIEFLLDKQTSRYLLSCEKEIVKEEKLIIEEEAKIERNEHRLRILRSDGSWQDSSMNAYESAIHAWGRSEHFPSANKLHDYLSSWRLYQFITAEMRGNFEAKRVFELERSGKNLIQVLISLHNGRPEIFDRVEELLKQAIPEIEKLLTPLTPDSKTYLALREREFEQEFDYYQLSDGTLKLLAYITAIALPESNLICFEEPENFVHARLQRLLVEILKNSEKQIILSTHSISFVNLVEPEDVIIIKKEEGETKASKVENPKELKKRLEELELGLGEYYYSGALGGVP